MEFRCFVAMLNSETLEAALHAKCVSDSKIIVNVMRACTMFVNHW